LNQIKIVRNAKDWNIKKFPNWFNGAVPSIINKNSEILIVGLAPGLNGANKTGRPFTGDYAGLTLFNTLKKYSLLKGHYKEDGNDNISLENCSITNAVRCVPPKNLPKADEIKNCENFLKSTISFHENLKVIVALGLISHKSIVSTFNLKQKDYKFGHSNKHNLSKRIKLIDSYHCSRYNINTKRLSQEMFDKIFIEAKKIILN
jgi:uracil-DNA glycosylase family 4